MSDLISRQALCEYALNQKDKSVTPNDIMRFPSAQPEKRTQERTETHACDCISRQAAISELMEWVKKEENKSWSIFKGSFHWTGIKAMLECLPSAQPELIEKEAYIRGFEQGRTQGMIDTNAEEVAQSDLQPTCNNLATDCISRKAALDGIADYLEEYDGIDENGNHDLKWCAMKEAELLINDLPSAQPEINCSEIPNTSDFVSRKAVREMVSAWAYDLMEQEDLNMALHDVDELQSAQQNVIHCKDCKHYRTTGAFGVPLHKEEYFCDADNYPKNDPGKEQRELPEWWFCAGAERKDNKYILDCQTCDLENPSGFKMRDRFTTVPKDVYEKMQMDDLREEQEERLGVAPILNPKT